MQDNTILIGEQASDVAGRGFVSCLVRGLVKGLIHPNCRLFPITLKQYEEVMAQSVLSLGIQHSERFTPYSVRHGGATWDFLAGARDIKQVQARGCWSDGRSMARYRHTGSYQRQVARLPAELLHDHERRLKELPALLKVSGV